MLGLLRAHPEWREELRVLLLAQELVELPTVVRELAAAVRGLTDRVDRLEATLEGLAAAVRGLTDRVDRLEAIQQQMLEVQQRLVERLEGVEEVQQRLVERLDRAETIQQQMLEVQQRLVERLEGVEEVQRRLVDQVGELQGRTLEQHYRVHAPAYFGRLLRRVRVVDFGNLADTLAERLPPDDLDQVLVADLILVGQVPGAPQPTEVWVVVEVSSRVDRRDVQRAAQRGNCLRRAGYRTVAAVAGREATQGARSAGDELMVAVLEDGRIQGWGRALERALLEEERR